MATLSQGEICKTQTGKGRRKLIQRGKGRCEGFSKQTVHGFSLAESLPGKKSFF